jgi:hypothetical protein
VERSRGLVRRRLARYLETLAHESNAAIVVQEENSVKLQAEPRYIPGLDKREIQGAPQEMPPGPSVTFRGYVLCGLLRSFHPGPSGALGSRDLPSCRR